MKRSSIEGLKHNAKLDVRLPDQLKDEFLARCRKEGVSSGAVIRSMMLDYVTAPAMAGHGGGLEGDDRETIKMGFGWLGRRRRRGALGGKRFDGSRSQRRGYASGLPAALQRGWPDRVRLWIP